MAKPVRLRLSRTKGFDLQALSLATNGLPAVVVTRATIWGNPFSVHAGGTHLALNGKRYPVILCKTHAEAVGRFRAGIVKGSKRKKLLGSLRGKNLACYCSLSGSCHADTLLELANRPICEEVSHG